MIIFFLWISNPFSKSNFEICVVVTDPKILSSTPVLTFISKTSFPIFFAIFSAFFIDSSCFFTVCFKFSSKILEFDLFARTPYPLGII